MDHRLVHNDRPQRPPWQFSIWRFAVVILLIAVYMRFMWYWPIPIIALSLIIGILLRRPWAGLFIGLAIVGVLMTYDVALLLMGWQRP